MLQLFVAFFVLCTCCQAQGYFSVLSYNCENAFDTIHDEHKNDYDFLPDGSHHWSRYRMFQKLKGIMKVIAAADEERPIDIVGLCEVENDSVLTYLTERTGLHRIGYKYLMTHSQDSRGIDVALMYSPYTFHPLSSESIHTDGLDAPTRDILHATGTVQSGDTIDVYMCHFPSKLGGKASEERAEKVVARLRANIDSVMSVRTIPYIIIMGDLNADYSTPLIKSHLNVLPLYADSKKRRNKKGGVSQEYSPTELVDLMSHRPDGSYKYHGQWSTIDHIIVSGAFLNNMYPLQTSYDDSGILAFPFLLEQDKTYGGKKPKRTFLWTKYNGGISDHLPVWARFHFMKK